MNEKIWLVLATICVCVTAGATEKIGWFAFSRAGYWETPGSPRRVEYFNLGWEFSLDAFKTCRAVSLPHGIDEGDILQYVAL